MAIERNNINYTLDDEFLNFMNAIKNRSKDYDYVCVRGKRCFNIMSVFFPEIDFITFSALMLHYKELSNFFEKYKRFPKILLIDDLIFDDREMAHDLQQLEDILVEEFLNRKLLSKSDNCHYHIYRKLADFITIYSYGKTMNNLSTKSVFLENMCSEKESETDVLMKNSLQLLEQMKQWNIANTDYTYSVRSQELLDIILKQQNGRIAETKWVRQEGTCMGERMILYTRLNGATSTNRIDTIRIFPDRLSDYKELPLISSYTFFGALSGKESHQIINEVRKELEKLGLTKLAEILKMSNNDKINNILLEHKMKFISCILSVGMLCDFCNDMYSIEHLESGALYGDFWKISRNFGKRTELTEEFKVIRKKEVRGRLSSIILNNIDSYARELISYNPNAVLNNEFNIDSTNLDKITDIMRNIMFRIEMQSKKLAYEQKNTEFDARNYQTSIFSNEPYGHDGIITFNKLFDLEEIRQSITSYSDMYYLIFTTIGLMDNYQTNLSIKSIAVPKGDNIVQNCITTNEQAICYLLEKLSSLIEPLAEMESNIFGSPQSRFRHFCNIISTGCLGIDSETKRFNYVKSLEITDDIKKRIIEEIMHLTGESSLELALEKLYSDIERFYLSGNSFYGFNNQNLKTTLSIRTSSSADTTQLKECLNDIVNIQWGDGLIQQSSPKNGEKKYSKKLTPSNKNKY